MKRYNCVYSLWVAIFVLFATSSYCKPHTYSWGKGTLQISAEGTLEEQGMNEAQNNILVKEAARAEGYRTLERFLSALPVDSTRNIGEMVQSNPEFAKQLRQWLVVHATLTHFKFTSETTGSVRIAINAQNFAKFVSQYDKPVVVKSKPTPKKTEKNSWYGSFEDTKASCFRYIEYGKKGFYGYYENGKNYPGRYIQSGKNYCS